MEMAVYIVIQVTLGNILIYFIAPIHSKMGLTGATDAD
jgi:hypothetical protein